VPKTFLSVAGDSPLNTDTYREETFILRKSHFSRTWDVFGAIATGQTSNASPYDLVFRGRVPQFDDNNMSTSKYTAEQSEAVGRAYKSSTIARRHGTTPGPSSYLDSQISRSNAAQQRWGGLQLGANAFESAINELENGFSEVYLVIWENLAQGRAGYYVWHPRYNNSVYKNGRFEKADGVFSEAGANQWILNCTGIIVGGSK